MSVLGADIFALSNAFDTVIIIQHDIKHILGRTLKSTSLIDSATLLNVMMRNAPSMEKRLMVDIKNGREAYNEEIINDIIWVRRKYNRADDMTKTQINNELVNAIDNSQINNEVQNSIIKTRNGIQQQEEKDQV